VKKSWLRIPRQGKKIEYVQGKKEVPDHLIIPYIVGDGTGPDIWKSARPVFDTAVEVAYQGARKIYWMELLAGEKAFKKTGKWLPEETLELIQEYHLAIKGPLTTPVGGGIRSSGIRKRLIWLSFGKIWKMFMRELNGRQIPFNQNSSKII